MRPFAVLAILVAVPAGAGAQPADIPLAEERQTSAPPPEAAEDPNSPREEKGTDYFFVGARYRLLMVPGWLVNLFAEAEEFDGPENHAFGAEFTYRKDDFDIIGAIWWADYSADEGFFRGSGDPRTSMESIRSDLAGLIVSADFVWSYPISQVVAFTYGVEVGFMPVFGSLVRQEAYEDNGWHRCPDESAHDGAPPLGGNEQWCEPESAGGTYGLDENGSGGDVPSVVPWAALLRLGLRIKPHRNFMMRVEGGFGVGFFLGLAANYGI
jgi:hypothetical protein